MLSLLRGGMSETSLRLSISPNSDAVAFSLKSDLPRLIEWLSSREGKAVSPSKLELKELDRVQLEVHISRCRTYAFFYTSSTRTINLGIGVCESESPGRRPLSAEVEETQTRSGA